MFKKFTKLGIIIVLSALVIVSNVLPCTRVLAAGWTTMNSGTTAWLKGIWGSSNSDIFAVGDTIIHYDGNSWSPMSYPTTNYLLDVWGTSNTDVYAVGDNGTILHYNGNSWSQMNSGTGEVLRGVWGSSSSDIFAVADWGLIIHYNGNSWSPMNSGTGKSLYGVWGTSSSNVFAGGTSGTILRYDGSKWTLMNSGTTASIDSIWGTSSSDVFAVGSSGTILHYNGSNWSSMVSGTTTGLQSVWGSAQIDVYAVGYTGTIIHYNGFSWNPMASGSTEELYGIWGSSHSQVYAAGRNGTVLYISVLLTIAKPPVAADDSYSLNQGQTLNIGSPGVLSNDTDINGDPLTAALVNTAGNGSLSLHADGSFSYSPYADFSGVDYFTYRANDGALDSNTATVTIEVVPSPVQEPVWEIGNLSITPGTVRVGEPVTISAEVFNTGPVDVATMITLRLIDGPVLGSQEVNIPPGASDTVVFIETFDEPGYYAIAIEDLPGEFFVEEVPEPQGEGINIWFIVGPLLGLLIVVLVIYYLLMRKRRASKVT